MPKKAIKYLCLDDERDIESACRRLQSANHLKIELVRPKSDWSQQVELIDNSLRSGDFDGLLIDFRLDETHHGTSSEDSDGKKVRYTAESLITELRRRSVEGGGDGSYPIVLWSTAAFLKGFYELNPAYSVAYDDIWDKASLPNRHGEYATKLIGLRTGYSEIAKRLATDSADITSLLRTEPTSVIKDLQQNLNKKTRGKPHTFQYALFITHDILEVNGPLIDSNLLHAYLGVSSLTSAQRDKIFNILGKDAIYNGVFADTFQRFWRDKIINRLESATGAFSWLSLAAEERVGLLMKAVKGIRLAPAAPLSAGYSTDYDCVCAITGRPLSRRNAFRLAELRTLSWKEAEYASGVAYRRNFNDLSKSRPLDGDDYERFCEHFIN